MKPCIATLLTLVLVGSMEAEQRTPHDEASRIQRGRKISVILQNGEMAQGRLLSVDQTELKLQPPQKGASALTLPFWDIRSVREEGVWKRRLREVPVIAITAPLYITMTAIMLPGLLVCQLKKNCEYP